MEILWRRTGASREVDLKNGVAFAPVPIIVDGKATEECLVALEQFLQGVEKEALAKAAGAGQEIAPRLFFTSSSANIVLST